MDAAALAAASVDAIFALYAEHGNSDYIGEAISSVEHAVQAAAEARSCGAGDAEVAAALLHDAGHLLGLQHPDAHGRMGDCGVMEHERVGAEFLEALRLPQVTCDLVRNHVNAKRWVQDCVWILWLALDWR